jgi:formate/nitrite transporter FocA (FNT family)
MDYVKPTEVVENMINSGAAKAALPVKDLLIRGFLAGALLGFATSLAITATIQTGVPLVGALVFPVGFVIIVLLGLELVTGSFSALPLARMSGRTSTSTLLSDLAWVFLGNLIGSVFYGGLLAVTLTTLSGESPNPLALYLTFGPKSNHQHTTATAPAAEFALDKPAA